MTVIKQKRMSEIDVALDIECNRCGKSCVKDVTPEYLHGHAEWGYGSSRDCTEWQFDLCEDCADALEQWMGLGKIDKREITVDGTPTEEWHRDVSTDETPTESWHSVGHPPYP
jgi:hypothetical protein